MEDPPLGLRKHQQAPVRAARALRHLVVVEREKDELLGGGVEGVEEYAHLAARRQFDALSDLGRHKQQLAASHEPFGSQVLEVERDDGVVEPAWPVEQLDIGEAQQALAVAQHYRVIVHSTGRRHIKFTCRNLSKCKGK